MKKLGIFITNLAFLFSVSGGNAATVESCSMSTMEPTFKTKIADFVRSKMSDLGIAYVPDSLRFENAGRATFQDFSYVQPKEENAFRVSFQTVNGNTISLVTPVGQFYGQPTVRNDLTLLVPDPTVQPIRDAEGTVTGELCVLLSHQGYNRWLSFVNVSQGNFVIASPLISYELRMFGWADLIRH